MTTHHTKGVLINDLDQTNRINENLNLINKSKMTSITSSSLKNSTSLQPQDYVQLNNTKKLQQSSTTNDLIELEKTKFFNILKSLFAIFDPECNGYIDLNELDVLGANNNEILNDVLNYIRSNRISNQYTLNPNKILTTINQNLIQTNINNNKNKFLVNFDEFVTASELVLDKRRQTKYQSFRQINENTNLTQSLSYNSNLNRQSLPIQKIINSSNSSSSSSSSSSTSSSATSSTVSIQNPSSLSPNTTQTLSQAFEKNCTSTSSIQHKTQENNSNQILNNANSCDLNVLIDKECYILKQGLESIECIKQWFTNQLIENKVKQTNINKLKYQNLFSIDKMLIDLRRLNDLNNYLNEFIKKNSMNSSVSYNKSSYDDIINRSVSNLTTGLNEPPSYKDYIEQFSCINSKTDAELDQYLKEKQDRIDSLQKEKSSLIRKLFEIKSDSENISKNILKLNKNTKLDSQNSFNLNEKEIPILIDKSNTTETTTTATTTTTTHKFL